MPATSAKAEQDFEQFRQRQTVEGRFLAYCRGRSRHFVSRQLMTFVCFSTLVFFTDVTQAILALVVALVADGLDSLVLYRIGRRSAIGARLPMAMAFTAMTGALQALSIVYFIVLLLTEAGHDAMTFAVTVCMAASLDAALLNGLHRGASVVRIAIYAVAIMGIFFQAVREEAMLDAHILFDALSVGLLAYIITMFVRQVHRAHARSKAKQITILESHRDLTQIFDALQESKQMNRRLGAIAERANDSIIVTDKDGRITWVNRAFSQIMGYAAQEVIGKKVTWLNGPKTSQAASDELVQARKNRRSARVELLTYHKDGHTIWLETSISPVFDETGEVTAYIGIERDIGAAKERERSLAEAKRMAEEASRAKHAFLATMSHEIRTPMNGVIGNAELLRDTSLSEGQRTLVDTITGSGEALLAIVNDILDFSSLEAGKLSVAEEPFAPHDVLDGVVQLLQPLAEARGLSLSLTYEGDLASALIGDAGRLRQILINLIGNAVKFTEVGEVAVTLCAKPAEGLGQQSLEVRVRDTGIGIAPDRLKRIFESFTQADSTVAGRFGGAGLGLSISRQLVMAMGGDITVTSQEGVGSEFVVTLDLAIAADLARDEPASIDSQTVDLGPPDLSDRRILVADDNRTNALLVRKMLSATGARLEFAQNGRDAVRMFCADPPDLVLMDMRMPIMDGLDATRALREFERKNGLAATPVIALTANAFAEDRALCAQAGMDGFLSKPLRRKDLFVALSQQLPQNTDGSNGAAVGGMPA